MGKKKKITKYDPKMENKHRVWDQLNQESRDKLVNAYPELKKL